MTSISVNGTTVLNGVLYDPFGPIRGWTWGNSTFAVRTYDTDGKIAQVDNSGLKTYGYDDAFRITGITDTLDSNLSWTYGYDLLDRLTWGSKTGLSQTFTYDANSNRLTQGGTSSSTYTISSTNNRLNSTSGALARTYTYDASGNALTYSTLTYTYNNAGRMKTSKVGSTTTTYVYNALEQRVKKSGGAAGTVVYWYDEAGHLLGEYNSSGALVQETVWLGDIPVATLRSGAVPIYYVHTDHLNTPRKVSRPSDNKLAWRWDSDPFGTAAPNENPQSLGTFKYNLRMPGQYFDVESGLSYNYFRDYDPAIGRYVESDPIGLRGGISTYGYSGQNPISKVDPSGLAYFAKRPLSGLPWLGVASCGQGSANDLANTELSHEQLFFEDSRSPSNVGFFEDGTLKDDPNVEGYRCKSRHYNDCIMRKAVGNVPLKTYCLLGRPAFKQIPALRKYNCQDWAEDVRKEYARLSMDPTIISECGCKQ